MSSLKEALTKKLVKEYQTRLRKMHICGKDTEDNRLALYKEFAERCGIKVIEAMQIANNINANVIIEKYQDTVKKRDAKSTEEIF